MAEARLKSILKKATSGERTATDPTGLRPRVDPRQLAIQHATIIQQRKDLESQILESIITLSEYPLVRDPPHSASNPAWSDVVAFKSRVRLFQPSDYDALVEERNANGLCGYGLCARPRSRQGKGGQWKLVSSGIARRDELEKWCSRACAKRALYIKVQLSETAAWERAGIPDIDLDLLDEGTASEDPAAQAAQQLDRLTLEDQKRAAEDSAALALERGDTGQTSANGLVKVTIREREAKPPRQGVSFADGGGGGGTDDDHLMLDGYKPKFGTKESLDRGSDVED